MQDKNQSQFNAGESVMKLGIILFILVVAIIGYVIYIYNKLVKNRQLVAEG
jgi:ABC-type phosphate transport system permease subunit